MCIRDRPVSRRRSRIGAGAAPRGARDRLGPGRTGQHGGVELRQAAAPAGRGAEAGQDGETLAERQSRHRFGQGACPGAAGPHRAGAGSPDYLMKRSPIASFILSRVTEASLRARVLPERRISSTTRGLDSYWARRCLIGSRNALSAAASFFFTSTSPTLP